MRRVSALDELYQLVDSFYASPVHVCDCESLNHNMQGKVAPYGLSIKRGETGFVFPKIFTGVN